MSPPSCSENPDEKTERLTHRLLRGGRQEMGRKAAVRGRGASGKMPLLRRGGIRTEAGARGARASREAGSGPAECVRRARAGGALGAALSVPRLRGDRDVDAPRSAEAHALRSGGRRDGVGSLGAGSGERGGAPAGESVAQRRVGEVSWVALAEAMGGPGGKAVAGASPRRHAAARASQAGGVTAGGEGGVCERSSRPAGCRGCAPLKWRAEVGG